MAKQRRWRRAVLALVLTPPLLFGLVLAALQLGSVREPVAGYLIGFANGAMDEKLVLDGVERLDPWGVRIRHVELRDERGRLIVDAYGVTSSIVILDLLSARVNLPRARVERARLWLPWLDDAPKKKKEKKQKEDDTPSGWRVDIYDASVGETKLLLKTPFGPVEAHALNVDGQYFWHEESRVVVRRAGLRAEVRGKHALDAVLEKSDWRTDTGGPVHLSGKLAKSPFRIEGTMGGVHVTTPWPQGALKVTAQRVTGEALAVFALGREWLQVPADLRLNVEATSQQLAATAQVTALRRTLSVRGSWGQHHIQASVSAPPLPLSRIAAPLPSGMWAADATVRYRLGRAGGIDADVRRLMISDVEVPPLTLRARQRGSIIHVQKLALRNFERNLQASGQMNVRNMDVQLDVALSALDLSKLRVVAGEPLAGVVDGNLDLRVNASALRLDGTLRAKELSLRKVRAKQVDAAVSAQGTPSRPAGRASLTVTGLHWSSLPLREIKADAALRDHQLSARGTAKGKELALSFDAHGRKEKDGYLAAALGVFQRKADHLRYRLHVQRREQNGLLSAQLAGSGGELNLKAQQSAGGIEAQLTAKDMELTPILSMWNLEDADGEVDGNAQVSIPYRRGKAQLDQTRLAGELALDLPLRPLFQAFAPSLSSLEGRLQAKLSGQGGLKNPQATLSAQLSFELPEHDTRAERATLLVVLTPEAARADLAVSDLEGALLNLSGSIAQAPEAAWQSLRSAQLPDFTLKAQLAPRRLDLMQGVFAYLASTYALDLPLRAGGTIKLASHAEQLSGDAALRVRLFGEALDATCVAGAYTDLDVNAQLDARELSIRARSFGDRGGKLEAQLHTSLLVSPGALPQLQPADAELRADALMLPSIPGFCSLSSGLAGVEAKAHGLGGPDPRAVVEMNVKSLGTARSEPLDLTVQGELSPRRAQLRSTFLSKGHSVAQARLKLPVEMEGAIPVPQLNEEARAELHLRMLPVAPLLSLGQHIGQPSGTVSGDLQVRGPLHSPRVEGALDLAHISLSIASLAQPLRDLTGRVAFTGDGVKVHNLTVRDRDGSARLDAEAKLVDGRSGSLRAELHAQDFPIRRLGEVMGQLDAHAVITGQLNTALDLSGKVDISSARFRLQGTGGSEVQPLERHREVRFVDARGIAEAQRTQKEHDEEQIRAKAQQGESLSLTKLQIVSSKQLSIIHRDFSVQLGLDLSLLSDAEGEKLVGKVSIHKGKLTLIGKRFEIERGSVTLSGDYPPNPELDLRASFDPPTGEKLYVEVHGPASDPIVSFSGAASSAEEAIAVVSGMQSQQVGAEEQAQADARGFATNITAGLLSATARRGLGNWVPLISVESDITGAPKTARAGFDASKLIPPFLRPLARGAYVEGIVGNTRQKRSGTVGLGVRLQVALPHDFVSSMGYGPGPTWATDLAWSP